MASKHLVLFGALLLAGAAQARAADSDKLQCVAALRLHSNQLAGQVRAGDEARKPELLQVLRQGGAFVGEAWLDGLGNEDAAKARLAQAETEVRALGASQAGALRSQCAAQADAMIEHAPGWQRRVIDRFAQSRMDKMLKAH
ncbi:hypothetical protein [Azohydromonas aeria]|uniref:hypothetical protein n=1 Tax=Azohydromonas aeria TaxID=2590212 RepID=UPI0012FBDD38|nr:hypothetical protein [Azohydromonas aeria]